MTGIGTAQKDDPQLTARAVATPRQPQRILVDSTLAISEKARMLEGGAWVFAAQADAAKTTILQKTGCEVMSMPGTDGKVDLHAMMTELGKRQINEVHVEAGAVLNGALLQAGLVDELLV